MWEMFSMMIQRVAPYYRTVLITGETGTGKELAARALHRLSPVSCGHCVVVNCSAVVETLFESELFGHVKGSFTDATHDKPGLFEHANGGTLLLDEIGDMPLASQTKLLQVLQTQEVQRIGALKTRKVDVRVIAATNHDLRALVGEKRFREDLYYRLSMVEIQLPRLGQRKEDLPLLKRHFIARFAELFKKEIRGLRARGYDDLRGQHRSTRPAPVPLYAPNALYASATPRAAPLAGLRHTRRAGAPAIGAGAGEGRRQSIQSSTRPAHRPGCAPIQTQEAQS
jgi:transcriptional regulator with GAF, ATPase, and Fis domain